MYLAALPGALWEQQPCFPLAPARGPVSLWLVGCREKVREGFGPRIWILRLHFARIRSHVSAYVEGVGFGGFATALRAYTEFCVRVRRVNLPWKRVRVYGFARTKSRAYTGESLYSVLLKWCVGFGVNLVEFLDSIYHWCLFCFYIFWSCGCDLHVTKGLWLLTLLLVWCEKIFIIGRYLSCVCLTVFLEAYLLCLILRDYFSFLITELVLGFTVIVSFPKPLLSHIGQHACCLVLGVNLCQESDCKCLMWSLQCFNEPAR